MIESAPPAPAVEYHDRSTALLFFGVLTLLLGVFATLMAPLAVVGAAFSTRTTGITTRMETVLPAVFMYGFVGLTMIGLGIGSIRARRWARNLLLIFAWTVLANGLLTVTIIAISAPRLADAIQAAQPPGGPQLPAVALQVVVGITLLVTGVLMVVLPGVWVLFYRRVDVRQTCEHRDPTPGWTDACPLPVLAVSVWLGVAAPMMALMPLAYHGLLPAFGTFLTGAPGALGYFVLAAVWAWSARAIYRLDIRGWWLAVGSFLLLLGSSFVTYARHDLAEIYHLMGYPEAEIAQIMKVNFLTRTSMLGFTAFFSVPVLGYLLWVKRFFGRRA